MTAGVSQLGLMSLPEIDELNTIIGYMGDKVGTKFLKIVGYLRRFGSVPSSEPALRSIMDCSARYLRERMWPFLQDWLVLSDDGRRYFSPAIPGINAGSGQERAIYPRAVPPEVSEVRRRAGAAGLQARQEKKRNLSLVDTPDLDFASPADANRDAKPMQTDAKDVANSTPAASGLQNFAWGFASDVARPLPPSLASTPSFQPSDKTLESKVDGTEGGRGSARAGADAPSMQTTMQTDANGHAKPDAKPDAKGHAKPPPTMTLKRQIAPDWTPSPESALEARKRGLDIDDLTVRFRDHYIGTGDAKADFDAVFRNWCRTEQNVQTQRQQTHMTMPFAGSRKKPTFAEAMMEKMRQRQAAEEKDGPIIDGMTG